MPCLGVCWLLTSTGSEGGLPVAQEIERQYKEKGILFVTHVVSNAFSMRETFDVVQKIYQREARDLGLAIDDIISEHTGATKPMSAGMVLACWARYPMEYVFGGCLGRLSFSNDWTLASRS